jgi:glycerol-3-phosphate dehydrogenase (NAD(P)+)
VATVLADGSRNRRAGELLGAGLPAGEIAPRLGQTAEALDALPVLAGLLREARVDAPATTSLAGVVEGRIAPERWLEQLSARGRAA